MTSKITDPACLAAISGVVGHAPPYSDVELTGLRELLITGARTLDGLQACVGLTHLRVVGSEVVDIGVCAGMPNLEHLEIIATRIGSMTGVEGCERLERVDLLYASLTDASDLLALPGFRRGALIGNPWDEDSWPRLQVVASTPGRFIELPADYDWSLTRQLWREHGVCWGPVSGIMPMVVRPGLPELTRNPYDGMTMVFIRHEMKQPGFTVAGMFSEYVDMIVTDDLSERARSRTLGSREDAARWIARSAFSEEEKSAFTQFVARFPSVPFFFASQARIDLETAQDIYVLPGWYLDMRRMLDGWLPNFPGAPIRFGEDGHWAVAGKDYYLGLYPHAADHEEALIAAGFVNVALAVEDPRALLAMRLNGDDRRLYAYDLIDVGQAILEGRNPSACFTPVIATYAEMLNQIVALLPRDRDPIVAV